MKIDNGNFPARKVDKLWAGMSHNEIINDTKNSIGLKISENKYAFDFFRPQMLGWFAVVHAVRVRDIKLLFSSFNEKNEKNSPKYQKNIWNSDGIVAICHNSLLSHNMNYANDSFSPKIVTDDFTQSLYLLASFSFCVPALLQEVFKTYDENLEDRTIVIMTDVYAPSTLELDCFFGTFENPLAYLKMLCDKQKIRFVLINLNSIANGEHLKSYLLERDFMSLFNEGKDDWIVYMHTQDNDKLNGLKKASPEVPLIDALSLRVMKGTLKKRKVDSIDNTRNGCDKSLLELSLEIKQLCQKLLPNFKKCVELVEKFKQLTNAEESPSSQNIESGLKTPSPTKSIFVDDEEDLMACLNEPLVFTPPPMLPNIQPDYTVPKKTPRLQKKNVKKNLPENPIAKKTSYFTDSDDDDIFGVSIL